MRESFHSISTTKPYRTCNNPGRYAGLVTAEQEGSAVAEWISVWWGLGGTPTSDSLENASTACAIQSPTCNNPGRYAGLVTAEQEGSLWLNGLVFGGVLGGPQQALMRGIFAQMQTLQEHVYYKTLQDDMPDLLAELLKLEGALQRYNPRILEKPSSPDRYHFVLTECVCLHSGLSLYGRPL